MRWWKRRQPKTGESAKRDDRPKSGHGSFQNPRVRRAAQISSVLAAIVAVLVFGFAANKGLLRIKRPVAEFAVTTSRALSVDTDTENARMDHTNKEAPTLGLRKGQTLVYAFSQNRTIKLTPGNIAGLQLADPNSVPIEMRVKQAGDLIVRVYDENEKGWLVGFELLNAHIGIEHDQSSSGKAAEQFRVDMAGEMLAFVLKSGRIQRLGETANISDETRNQWRDILARWQVVLSDDVNDANWTRTEEDSTGSYVAVYSRTAPGRPFEISKRKHRYLSFRNSQQAAFSGANTIRGATVVLLRPYQTLIEGREQMHIPDLGISSDVVFAINLKNAAMDTRIDAHVSASKAALLELIPASSTWTDGRRDGKRGQRAAGVSGNINEEIAALKRLFADGKAGTPEEIDALAKIADIIRDDDTSIDTVLDELARAEAEGDLASALTGVLGATGTPAAQLALLAISTNANWPDAHKQMALFSFAQVTDPVPQVEASLQSLYEQQGSLAGSALMVLAAMGDRLRDTDPRRFNDIGLYVIDASNLSDLSGDQHVVMLNAIGNLGPREVPNFVQNALKSDDTLIRQEAIESLQRIRNDGAYNLLLDSIRNDPVDKVRAAAVKTMANTEWQGSQAELLRIVNHDGSTEVRQEALIGLAQWFDDSPAIVDLFRHVSERDRSGKIRELARQLITSRTAG